MPHLVVLKGSDPGLRLALDQARVVLGREPGCDIVLDEEAVSRRHAILSQDGDKYYIEDGDGTGRKSRNKTYVNNQQVPFPKRVALKDNDAIKVCDFWFTFRANGTGEALPRRLRYQAEPKPTAPMEPLAAIDASVSHSSSIFINTQPADKLRIILEISNSLSKTLDLDALLPRIVESLLEIFKQADRGFLILVDESTGGLTPQVVKTRQPGEESRSRFSASVARKCLETMDGLLFSNDANSQLPNSDSVLGLALQSAMCAPLWSHDHKALGVLQLDTQNPKRKFVQDDLYLLMGVASQASIALANAELYRDSLAQERVKRDLTLAAEVQRSFLPEQLPEVPGYEFFARNESALAVGGDYYDFLPLGPRGLGILLGDVAGKGVAAALVMCRFCAEARACLRTEADLVAAVRQLNTVMQSLGLTDRFMTLAALLLDPETHTVTAVNAGHPSPLLLRRATGAVEELTPAPSGGPPLGLVDGYVYECSRARLQPGDSLVLYSDGVTEAMDVQEQQFGTEGLLAVLQPANASPRALGERILQAVSRHAAGCSQQDDITLVCFGRIFP